MNRVTRWLRVGRLREWLYCEVPEANVMPWGHGVAYRRWDRHSTVTFPMPVHLLVGLTRRAFLWLRFCLVPWGKQSRLEDLRAEAYHLGRVDTEKNTEARERLAYGRGQRDGRERGYVEGWNERQRVLEEAIESEFAVRRQGGVH